MRKKILFYAPMILLLLTSCGATNEKTNEIQTRYANIESAVLEAEVISHLEEEDRTYQLHCTYNASGACETCVTAPQALSGLTAVLEGGALKLRYDGSCLSAGEGGAVSPADCLPRLMRAIAQGYVKEQGSEKLEGETFYYARFDTTGTDGEATEYAVWFAKDDAHPCYWEIACGGSVVLSGKCQSFTATEKQADN